MKWFAVTMCLALGACATPYQETGLRGGVTATRISEDTARIYAHGNGYTSAELIEQYSLRKAAEETIKDGFGHFQIIASTDQTRKVTVTTPGSASTTATVTGYGNFASGQAHTTYVAPSSSTYTKPAQSMTIKMYKGSKPADAPDNVYNAEELLRYLTPPAKT